jgi:hypothetical protein
MSTRVPRSRKASWLRAPLASLTQQNRRFQPKHTKNLVPKVSRCAVLEPLNAQIVRSDILRSGPNTPLATMTWAQLLKRTFAFDILHCERCSGRARVIAAITERAVID